MLDNEIFYLLLVLGVFLVAYFGSSITYPNLPWFGSLQKPRDYPGGDVFGSVWTLMYGLIIISTFIAYIAASAEVKKWIIIVTLVALVLNFLWSYTFFSLRQINLGMVIIAAMIITAVATLWIFYQTDSYAYLILVPYLLWLFFAFYLNSKVSELN